MNKYVIGDTHGESSQLLMCLESVNFDYKNDQLIHLGDVVDRGFDSYGCVELLLKISNLKSIKGNHDDCWFQYLKTGEQDILWNQGSKETYMSYYNNDVNPEIHFDFFDSQLNYYIDEDNNCFVHGGFNRHKLIEETGKTHGDISDLWWDRDLLNSARSYSSMKNNEYKFKMKNNFKEVFVGHTPVQYFGDDNKPMRFANIWDLDCGAGKFEDGKVCIMNVKTKEFWIN